MTDEQKAKESEESERDLELADEEAEQVHGGSVNPTDQTSFNFSKVEHEYKKLEDEYKKRG
jgi:hypothetical protein